MENETGADNTMYDVITIIVDKGKEKVLLMWQKKKDQKAELSLIKRLRYT